MRKLIEYPTYIFPTKERAEKIAEANSKSEIDNWTYEVVPFNWGYAVEVKDENGHEVGYL